MTGSDTLELIRLFTRIVDAGSLSGAARLFGLSQPSASRQLKQLEAILGTQLIWRSSSEFALTASGEQFLLTARRLLADWDAAVDGANLANDTLRGTIRVAAPVMSGQNVFAQFATDFALLHPEVSIDLRLTETPGELAAGGYDLWIRAGPIADTSLIVRDLWRADRIIVGGGKHVRVAHPRDLAAHKAVRLLNYVPAEVPLIDRSGDAFMLRMTSTFTTDNTVVALTAIRKGLGYGILPLWLVRGDLDSGTLVHLCPDWVPPAITLSLAYPQTRFRPARVKAFLAFVRSELVRLGEDVVVEAAIA